MTRQKTGGVKAIPRLQRLFAKATYSKMGDEVDSCVKLKANKTVLTIWNYMYFYALGTILQTLQTVTRTRNFFFKWLNLGEIPLDNCKTLKQYLFLCCMWNKIFSFFVHCWNSIIVAAGHVIQCSLMSWEETWIFNCSVESGGCDTSHTPLPFSPHTQLHTDSIHT